MRRPRDAGQRRVAGGRGLTERSAWSSSVYIIVLVRKRILLYKAGHTILYKAVIPYTKLPYFPYEGNASYKASYRELWRAFSPLIMYALRPRLHSEHPHDQSYTIVAFSGRQLKNAEIPKVPYKHIVWTCK